MTSFQIINSDSDKVIHTALDMLLLLSQEWMETLDTRYEMRAVSLDTSHAFDVVWHPGLLSKLSVYGIQVQPPLLDY